MVAVNDIKPFVECLENYFTKRSLNDPVVETPYLTDSVNDVLFDYTGVISISGAYQGNIYFTAPKPFLEKLIEAHGQSDFSDSLTRDMVGEVTNTLSGNSRKELGSDFVISVPSILDGGVEELDVVDGCHSYVVPIEWCDSKAAMVVSVVKV